MLIETRIDGVGVPLTQEQLNCAVKAAQQAMRQVCSAIHEPVILAMVSLLEPLSLVFCVRSLVSVTDHEFIYHLRSDELLPFRVSESHLDVREERPYLPAGRTPRLSRGL